MYWFHLCAAPCQLKGMGGEYGHSISRFLKVHSGGYFRMWFQWPRCGCLMLRSTNMCSVHRPLRQFFACPYQLTGTCQPWPSSISDKVMLLGFKGRLHLYQGFL